MCALGKIIVSIFLPRFLLAVPCDYGSVQSAWDDTCVETSVILLGGRNINGWRKDGEIWTTAGRLDAHFPDCPYPIDAPFGWWSSVGLLVCGGRNWDVDMPESRCWRFDQCEKSWIEETGNIFHHVSIFEHLRFIQVPPFIH